MEVKKTAAILGIIIAALCGGNVLATGAGKVAISQMKCNTDTCYGRKSLKSVENLKRCFVS
jgi:hypothetical protein